MQLVNRIKSIHYDVDAVDEQIQLASKVNVPDDLETCIVVSIYNDITQVSHSHNFMFSRKGSRYSGEVIMNADGSVTRIEHIV